MCVFRGIWSEMIHHGLWCQIIHWDWGLAAEMQLRSDNGISSCCDRQDWCWEEVTGRTLGDIPTRQAQEWGSANQAVGERWSSFLSCAFLSSQHWSPSKTPWSTIPQTPPDRRWVPGRCSDYRSLSFFLQLCVLSLLHCSSLHKPEGPFRELPAALSSPRLITPAILLFL